MENKQNGKLGLVACIAVLTGGCIGSAIFSLSGMTMINGGPASLLSWVLSAVILGAYGLLVVELAVRYPKSGGVFVFPARAIGKGWGFFSAWGYIVSNIIAVSFSAITIGTFVCAGFSPLTSGAVWQYQNTITIVSALASVALITVLNLIDIQTTGKINNILVGVLSIVMVVYVVFAFSSPAFSFSNYHNFFRGALGSTGWIRSIPNAMVAYGTCIAIAFMVGNVQNPQKNVPKSLIISLTIVVVLYLAMISSTLGIVTWELLADENGAFQPMFIAINHMGYGTGVQNLLYLVIGVAGLLALITTLLVIQALNSCALQSVADDGFAPRIFSRKNKHGMPYVSTIILSLIAAILCCFNNVTNLLVNLGSITNAVTMMIVMYAFIQAQKTKPAEGMYRAPGGIPMAVITMAVVLLTYLPSVFASDAGSMWIYTFIIYLTGLMVYLFYNRRNGRLDS